IFHLVLITSPKMTKWNNSYFILYVLSRILEALKFNFAFAGHGGRYVKKGLDPDKYLIWKKVLLGVVISIPVLFIVLQLLMAADSQFERIIGGFPQWLEVINAESFFRILVVLIYTCGFFGLLQVLFKKQIQVMRQENEKKSFALDGVIAVTVLVLFNAVYVLFVIVQFKYFFSGTLQGDYTFAQYARRGFFELLFVTMINLSITVAVIALVSPSGKGAKKFIQSMLTVLVLTSGVILSSAFLRLLMYEDAYGFTFTRVLVHSFMIFLMLILSFTAVKIWLEKVSLFHFYFITSLIYYTAINIVNIDQIVVKQNMDRYESTGKIDVQYLSHFSSTGVLGLIDLYKKKPNIPELRNELTHQKNWVRNGESHWQSYNLIRSRAAEQLKNLSIK
ncbi:MAG: DUF4173 domain-containing protein, partial [Bacillota bacterium]|nr:DUF4173 domain-containing protein [Bacillota bacterium]